jgi:hypothetical protein
VNLFDAVAGNLLSDKFASSDFPLLLEIFLHRFLRYFRNFSEEFCRRVTKRVRAIAFNSGATVAFASNRNGWLQL